VRGRGIGIALAGFKSDQTPLNSDDILLIRHLLNQAALAIENAQLVGQMQTQLEEMQSLKSYSEGIFESSPAGIAVVDEEQRLISVNPAFLQLVALSGPLSTGAELLLGRSLHDVLPLVALPEIGDGPIETSFCDLTGQEHTLQLSLAEFRGGRRSHKGRSRGLRILVVHDVSERVEMERALKENDRLAALGMLAAGVAHEVNTPITGISSYAQMLLSETAESDPRYSILKKVEKQTFRASRIVNNLLLLARDRQKERRPVQIVPLLEESLDLLGDRLQGRRIAIDWTAPAEDTAAIEVLGCDGELQQVFTNLILNAVDAMSGPGAAPSGNRLTLGVEADREAVRVKVLDTGPGIPPERLATIFDPFVSTKIHRGGTGLGLTISHDIVQRHGGTLVVASNSQEGACFSVELPRHWASKTA
jgi:two-component system, NtrC family, sensor kinase